MLRGQQPTMLSILVLYFSLLHLATQGCFGASLRNNSEHIQYTKGQFDSDTRYQVVDSRASLLYAISAEDPRKPNVIDGNNPLDKRSTVSPSDQPQQTTTDNPTEANFTSLSPSTETSSQQNPTDPSVVNPNDDQMTSTIDPNINVSNKPTGGGGSGSGSPDGQPPTKKQQTPVNSPVAGSGSNLDLSLIIYSALLVYISLIKLIYHNIATIKKRFTESG